MANTFTQIHIHAIFAVQNRMSLIQKSCQERLYEYIIAIIQKHGHKVLSIGGMPDHIHILFGFRPTQALSSLMQEVKRDSSEWINQQRLVTGRFVWQCRDGVCCPMKHTDVRARAGNAISRVEGGFLFAKCARGKMRMRNLKSIPTRFFPHEICVRFRSWTN